MSPSTAPSAPLQILLQACALDQSESGGCGHVLVGFEDHQKLLFVRGLQERVVLLDLFHEFVGHPDGACSPIAGIDFHGDVALGFEFPQFQSDGAVGERGVRENLFERLGLADFPVGVQFADDAEVDMPSNDGAHQGIAAGLPLMCQ